MPVVEYFEEVDQVHCDVLDKLWAQLLQVVFGAHFLAQTYLLVFKVVFKDVD